MAAQKKNIDPQNTNAIEDEIPVQVQNDRFKSGKSGDRENSFTITKIHREKPKEGEERISEDSVQIVRGMLVKDREQILARIKSIT